MTWNRTTALRAVAGALLVAGGAAACAPDLPLEPGDARMEPPGAPSRLLNPACAGTGGTTHPNGDITTLVTWARADNPHRVTGTNAVDAGGRLTLEPGVLVCFDPGTGLIARNGGRLHARGRDTAVIVLTARDPALGWEGMDFSDAPGQASYLTNVRIEHVNVFHTAVFTQDSHTVEIDSAVIRQSGRAVELLAPGSALRHSTVDTTTYVQGAAVVLGDSTRFVRSTIRRAAGVGLLAVGPNAFLLRGRIEESGGVGLRVPGSLAQGQPLRVVGGGSYGAELSASALAEMYSTPAEQDSLLGNALDTLNLLGGPLHATVTARQVLPWHVKATITVESPGVLRAQPGARLVFDPGAGITANAGGRLNVDGAVADPVVFTASDPALGWSGISLDAFTFVQSNLINVHVEHVGLSYTAVTAVGSHKVVIDSAVFRRNGRAASLFSNDSRISRTRVDTTLTQAPAVELGGETKIESTLIRTSSGVGLAVWSSTVEVVSCEIRDSVEEGIRMYVAVEVHHCNLVGNLGVGIHNAALAPADVEDNWWGDAAGPTGPGGDGASGLLDYIPWRTSPFVLPYVP